MRKLMSYTPFLTYYPVFWFILSIIISYCKNDYSFLARSGAVITIFGLLMSMRPLIRKGARQWYYDQKNIDLGSLIPTEEESEKERQIKLDSDALTKGLYMSIAGTFIWGYIDLIINYVLKNL